MMKQSPTSNLFVRSLMCVRWSSVVCLICAPGTVFAGPLTNFVIDPTQSFFAMSGTFFDGQSNKPLVAQFPESLSNALSGNIVVDLNTPGMIQLSTNTAIVMGSSFPDALPGGTPAQLAFLPMPNIESAYAAMRNATWTMTGSSVITGDTLNGFLELKFTSGELDGSLFPQSGIVKASLIGNDAIPKLPTLLDHLADGRDRLTFTLESTSEPFGSSTDLLYSAEIVAYSTPAPEPSSFAIALTAGFCLILFALRTQKQNAR